MAGQVIELNRQGVLLSRRAAGDRALVFASLGPSGRLQISGDVTVGEWEAAFAEQAAALAGAGADGLVVETMSDPDEAAAAVRAARSTGLPVVACMVFDSGRGRDRTMMGTTPEEAVQALTEAGADVIGANCGQGIEGFIPVCAALRAATKLPLWIKANAGLPTLADGRAVYRTTAERFADEIPALLEAGADFVGGCCGTTPEFIAEVRRRWSRPPSRPTSP